MPKGATASTTTTRIISVFRKTSSLKYYSLIFISTTVATGLIFVISSLISFCFREDLFQYFKKLWLIGGEYRLELWNRLLDYIGDDIISLWTYGSIIVLTVTYWFVGGIYTYLDVTNKPAALRRYKIQPGTNEPVDTKRVIQVIVNVTLNQTVVSFPISYVISNILVWRRTPPARDLPPAHQTAIHIILCILFLEAGIYYAHRLLHHRKLYKYFHKRHHEWTAPIAIVAFYSHPVEHVLTVLIPAYTGIIILNCHVFTAWVWFTLAITFSLSDHSGYHLPFFPSPEFHDYHHYKFNNCFGFLGILDRFHGTDAQFRKSMAYKRHKILKGFIPTRELYPEVTNNNSKRKK